MTIIICISLIIILCIVIIWYSIFSIRVLVGIPTIDRDYDKILDLLKSKFFTNYDMLIICRITDITIIQICKLFNIKFQTVEPYEIEGSHNINKICEKRNLLVEYAKNNSYDKILMIDSDIRISSLQLYSLIFYSNFYDVVTIPYKIKWAKTQIVGKNNQIIIPTKFILPIPLKCDYVPAGCTIINVNNACQFKVSEKNSITSEEIGFCENCKDNKLRICYLTSESTHLMS